MRHAPQGHLPEELPIALVTLIIALLPTGAQVVLLGDGAFDGTQLQQIEEQYEAALEQAQTAPHRPHRRKLQQAYAQARRKQQEVYKEIRRQWDVLFASYRQLLLGQQAVPSRRALVPRRQGCQDDTHPADHQSRDNPVGIVLERSNHQPRRPEQHSEVPKDVEPL